MTTGDSRVNFLLKRMMSHTRISGNFFDYLRNEQLNLTRKLYQDRSGLLTSNVTLSVDYVSNLIDISPSTIEGITDEGNILLANSSYTQNIPFENVTSDVYWIGLHYCEVPDGIYANQRTSVPEYDTWKSEIGKIDEPDSVVDNGDGTITFNVNTLLQSGVDYSGRIVKVWLKDPVSLNESIAIEDLTVSYSSPNNTVTTSNTSLGQSTISTDPSQYSAALIGPLVYNDGSGTPSNPFASDVIIVGYITGGSPGSDNLDYQVYLYEVQDTDHAIQNILSCNTSQISSVVDYTRPRVLGVYDESLNVHSIIRDFNSANEKEYVSYNGHEYYENSAITIAGRLLSFGCDNNGNRVIGTTSNLYYSTAMGTWTSWPAAPSVQWAAVEHDRNGLWILVDSTNATIYSATTVGGTLTVVAGPSAWNVSGNIHPLTLVHTHHWPGKLSPIDPGNPLWILTNNLGYQGGGFFSCYLQSTDGNTWTTPTLSGEDPFMGETSAGASGVSGERQCYNCLAYSPITQTWIHVNQDATITGTQIPTVVRSIDNGITWTEIVDAFGFSDTTKYPNSGYPNTGNGHRVISCDERGNFIVLFVKKETRVNKAPIDTYPLHFISTDDGLTWQRIYPKQLEDMYIGEHAVDSWLGGEGVNFITSYSDGSTLENVYITSTLRLRD